MFEIEVFSNPLNALAGEGGFLHHDNYIETTMYDEDLIKPALLLADCVHLRSHRLDLLLSEQRDLEMTGRFAPVYSRLMEISNRRAPRDLAFYGLSDADLLSDAEIAHYRRLLEEENALREKLNSVPLPTNVEALRAQRASNRAQLARFNDDWNKFLDRAEPFVRALRRRLRESIESFQSPAMSGLAERGLLIEDPWDDLPKSRPRQIQDDLLGPNAEFERAFLTMAEDLAHTPSSVMVDDELEHSLRALGAPAVSSGTGLTVAGAVKLVQMVEGVTALPLDEMADVREDLAAYIGPFRSFVLDVSGDVDWGGADDAERERLLKQTWESNVAPAIAEMEAHVRSASFVRNAIDVFAEGSEAFQSIGLAVGTWTAAGLVGFSTLSATVGAAPPLIKAVMRTVRAKEEVKRNRAYLVHALSQSRAVKRARKSGRRA
ncbi:hypothetical protein [Microbacterium marinilacus]|uniref:hypothetical protein n=1 Tax=Microbacterium marinilacus TaxID=415209 RepID=UPI001C8F0F73|nr:hypothetical protein [Microbacterium marinilacus]MBY0689049.1 hypothetical protein [Microbacterium marinilacus]